MPATGANRVAGFANVERARVGLWGGLELDHFVLGVLAHLAFKGAEIVSRIKLGDANEPHRHTAPGARWLEGRDRPVSLGMKLRHVPPARKFIECINSVALI